MRLRFAASSLAVALLLLALTAAPSLGALSPVLQQCNSGRLTSHFTVAQLDKALQTMPPDLSQYTDCPDIIRRALDVQLAKSHANRSASSGSSGSSVVPAWLIVVLVIVALGGAGATVAARRRRGGGDAHGDR